MVISDVDIARPVHRHATGAKELCLDRRASVPAEAEYSGPRNRGDRPRRIHLADAIVTVISDVDIARRVHRQSRGAKELRLDRRASVPAEAAFPGPRDRGDRPRRIHLADAVVSGIGDVNVAGPVHRQTRGAMELRLDRRASVPAEAVPHRPRDLGDRPRRIHLADAVVDGPAVVEAGAGAGDVEVAGPVHRHTCLATPPTPPRSW